MDGRCKEDGLCVIFSQLKPLLTDYVTWTFTNHQYLLRSQNVDRGKRKGREDNTEVDFVCCSSAQQGQAMEKNEWKYCSCVFGNEREMK